MNDKFRIVSDAIRNRRSIKPAKMNGRLIPNETVMELLKLADWAPTHKITEPWRFTVFAGDKAKAFALEHAELYKSSTPQQEYSQDKYEKILGNGKYSSHIIAAVMKRSKTVSIPEIEEIAATAASIENLLIAASAAGLAGFWSTGGMTHKKEMKEFLKLDTDDIVMGLIYLGYSDTVHEGKRIIPLDEKIDWK